jgi:DNA-binding CsgD family transcriptional regulator
MTAISPRSEASFVKAVETIYDCALAPERWPLALQAIADVFDDAGCLLIHARDDGSFGYIVSPSMEEAQAEYLRNWCHCDVRAIRSMEIGFGRSGDTISDYDILSPEEIETEPYYTEFLGRFNLKWFLGASISPDPRIAAGISVQRIAAKPPYSSADRDVISRLARHAEQSLRLSVRLMDAEMTAGSLAAALSRMNAGVFILDGNGRSVFTNELGNSFLREGLFVAENRLLPRFGADRAVFETELGRLLDGDPERFTRTPRPMLIQRLDGRPVAVYILPVGRRSDALHDFLASARVIVLAIDAGSDSPADPALVRDLLGLTLGEARVASLIGKGLPPRDAAQSLGITEETARTTLKRVFSKLGVNRQSELTALLTRLVLTEKP